MIALLETINQIDRSFFLFLNGMHNSFMDVIMFLFTRTETWLIFYLPIIYFIIKKHRAKAVLILLLLALSILVSDQLSVFVKETVKRLRPTHDPTIQHLVHNVLKKGGLYSFFSSHATNTFAVAMFLAMLFKNISFSFLIFSWAFLVSYTRIYIGVHYPFDILTGILAGLLIGLLIFKLLILIENWFFVHSKPKIANTRLNNRESSTIWLVLILFIVCVSITVKQLLHLQFI